MESKVFEIQYTRLFQEDLLSAADSISDVLDNPTAVYKYVLPYIGLTPLSILNRKAIESLSIQLLVSGSTKKTGLSAKTVSNLIKNSEKTRLKYCLLEKR